MAGRSTEGGVVWPSSRALWVIAMLTPALTTVSMAILAAIFVVLRHYSAELGSSEAPIRLVFTGFALPGYVATWIVRVLGVPIRMFTILGFAVQCSGWFVALVVPQFLWINLARWKMDRSKRGGVT